MELLDRYLEIGFVVTAVIDDISGPPVDFAASDSSNS